METQFEESENRSKALSALDKMKKLEAESVMHMEVINDRLIVCCKNKDNIDMYRTLKDRQ